jgi:hypothetical protein
MAMLAVVVAVMAAAFFGLDAWVQARAASTAAQSGAALVHTSFVGFGMLALLLGMEELMRWACGMFAGRYRVNGFLSGAAAKLKPQPLLARWGARRQLSGPVRRATGPACGASARRSRIKQTRCMVSCWARPREPRAKTPSG